MNTAAGHIKNLTLNDIQLAAAYYPVLVDQAKLKEPITYGELVAKAKQLNPGNTVVQNAIATSAGRKLSAVRKFTNAQNYPDLTSLVIGKGSGDCGGAYTDNFDPEEVRKEVFAFDWSNVSKEFDLHIKGLEKATTPRKPRKKDDATKLMAEFYFCNKKSLPPSIQLQRDSIIELLMEGISVEDAFSQALENAG